MNSKPFCWLSLTWVLRWQAPPSTHESQVFVLFAVGMSSFERNQLKRKRQEFDSAEDDEEDEEEEEA